MTHLIRKILRKTYLNVAAGRRGAQASGSAAQSAKRNVPTETSTTVTECSELNTRSVNIAKTD